MAACPFCDTELIKEKREIEKGIYAAVEVCPKCRDEWVDEKEHDRLVELFKRKAFNLSGSIAVRLPKEIADALEIKEGTELTFTVSKDKKILISKSSK